MLAWVGVAAVMALYCLLFQCQHAFNGHLAPCLCFYCPSSHTFTHCWHMILFFHHCPTIEQNRSPSFCNLCVTRRFLSTDPTVFPRIEHSAVARFRPDILLFHPPTFPTTLSHYSF